MKSQKIICLIPLLIAMSCTSENTYQTSKGTKVNILNKGSNEAPSDTLISYFTTKYETEEGRVLFETTEQMPSSILLDSNFFKNEGDFFEVIGKMKVGDRVAYSISATSLFKDNFGANLPDSVEADDLIKVSVAFLEQVSMQDYLQKSLSLKREQMLSQIDTAQLTIDVAIIDAYLEENAIDAIKSPSGIRYVVTKQGDGPKPQLGEAVKVHYAGRMLTGELFDTSIKEVAKENGQYNEGREPYEPYPIKVYDSPVITGWHEGISLLNEGTKATLYIPSPLAYGPRDRSELIKANSILVFDVELVEVGETE